MRGDARCGTKMTTLRGCATAAAMAVLMLLPTLLSVDPRTQSDDGTDVNVSLRFHVTWTPGDCAASRSEASATVQGRALAATLTPEFVEGLCALEAGDARLAADVAMLSAQGAR